MNAPTDEELEELAKEEKELSDAEIIAICLRLWYDKER
mgnify:CR=1 FL=1